MAECHTTPTGSGIGPGAGKLRCMHLGMARDRWEKQGLAASLYPLSFPCLIRIVFVRSFYRLSGVQQRMDIRCHAGSARGRTWSIDAFERIAGPR
jgi:hypothetical protein